jgi:hypothetical protein
MQNVRTTKYECGQKEGGREREIGPVFHSQLLQGADRCRLDPCSYQLQDDPPACTDQYIRQFDGRKGDYNITENLKSVLRA